MQAKTRGYKKKECTDNGEGGRNTETKAAKTAKRGGATEVKDQCKNNNKGALTKKHPNCQV